MRPGGWRQVLLRGGIFGGTSFQFFAHAGGVVVAKAALCGVGPVSYTHLDVYKRQLLQVLTLSVKLHLVTSPSQFQLLT